MAMDTSALIAVMQQLIGTISAVRLYSLSHPQTQGFIDKLHAMILSLLEVFEQVNFDLIEGEWTSAGVPLLGSGVQLDPLAVIFNRKRIARLGFLKGLTLQELEGIVLCMSKTDLVMPEISKHIYYGQIALTNTPGVPGTPNQEVPGTLKKPQEPLVIPMTQEEWSWIDLKRLYHQIAQQSQVSTTEGDALAMAFFKTFNASANPLAYLADIKTEDEYTYVHTINVALLTMALAKKLGFERSVLVDITYAALMHDVGKMLIPDEILNKPGRLNDQEMAVMRSHPVLGAQYIAKQKQLPRLTVVAALEHHIRFDGKGYPNLGANWKPHIVSQMISVADIYDALRSRRPYREPLPNEEIVKSLKKESGSALNPQLVDVFLRMIAEY